MTLVDVVPPSAPAGYAGAAESVTADLSSPGEAEALAAKRADVLFHLAAIVSGEAEADFDKGYRINLDGTRHLFEAVRREGMHEPYRPRLVFTSSIAVFGAPFPERIGDAFFSTPLTSYGTQKAIGELLLADYSRRGFFDGIGIRLPTICVRPGRPNLAASGFFSNILREPLSGQEAVLPVSTDVRHWFASPRAAVGSLLHAATLDLEALGPRRTVTPAGPVRHGGRGDRGAAPRRRRPRRAAHPPRARRGDRPHRRGLGARLRHRAAAALGFRAETSIDEIVRVHVEDELGGRVGG